MENNSEAYYRSLLVNDNISYVGLNRRLVLNEVKPNVYREQFIKAMI